MRLDGVGLPVNDMGRMIRCGKGSVPCDFGLGRRI